MYKEKGYGELRGYVSIDEPEEDHLIAYIQAFIGLAIFIGVAWLLTFIFN